ncbi:MAG TPA: hypothetical protein VK753_03905, partial [Xanthomonadaceae bacterium]|nr:hypothetical protein [Xanthomonadaceae bacterium]
ATTIGIVLIVGHDLLDSVNSTNPIWSILYGPGVVLKTPQHVVFAVYALIPWIGVTAVGYGLGQVYRWEPERRRRFLLRSGIALIAAFVAIRGLNGYGDFSHWAPQKTFGFSILAWLNTSKYPPSLLFLLMTLGPAILLLWSVDRTTPRFLRPALVIGKVPLAYYLLHFALIHALAVVTCYMCYGSAHWMFESPDLAHYPFSPPPGWGYPLPIVYAVWIFVVCTMYPFCRWYAAVKQRRHDVWLSYL